MHGSLLSFCLIILQIGLVKHFTAKMWLNEVALRQAEMGVVRWMCGIGLQVEFWVMG